MNDKEFLQWIHDRLKYVHKENPGYDYMHKLRAIIEVIPEEQMTANVASIDRSKSKGISLYKWMLDTMISLDFFTEFKTYESCLGELMHQVDINEAFSDTHVYPNKRDIEAYVIDRISLGLEFTADKLPEWLLDMPGVKDAIAKTEEKS